MAIGSDIVAKAMKHEGVTDFFYIMGAPMLGVEKACMTLGLRGIDVRHEQAAAMAGFAYSRLLNRPSFCMAASGPGVTNLPTGIAHAWADCTPVIALGAAAGRYLAPRRVPGYRPARNLQAVHQVVGPRAPREAHPRAHPPCRNAGDDRQAGPGLPRHAGGRPLPGGRRVEDRVPGAL